MIAAANKHEPTDFRVEIHILDYGQTSTRNPDHRNGQSHEALPWLLTETRVDLHCAMPRSCPMDCVSWLLVALKSKSVVWLVWVCLPAALELSSAEPDRETTREVDHENFFNTNRVKRLAM